MLSFLASFILHLLCNEILWNSQANVQTPQRNTGVPGKERQQSVRVGVLFTIHWFLNAAEMQQHSLEAEDQIITPAVLSLPKGGVAFTSPGFLLVLKTCLLPCTGSDACQTLWWTSFHRLILSCPILTFPTLSTLLAGSVFHCFDLLEELRSRRSQRQESVVQMQI